MKPNVIVGAVAVLGLLGWSIQPSWADPEHEYAHASSSGHGCCEEMMEHMAHHGHAADHLRHLLKHQKEIGLTEEAERH